MQCTVRVNPVDLPNPILRVRVKGQDSRNNNYCEDAKRPSLTTCEREREAFEQT